MSKGNIARSLSRLENRIDDIRKSAHQEFVRVTPIRTGNARRSTDLKGKEIQANYDYAVKLEKDHTSKQAPKGMSSPTIDHVKKIVRRVVG